MGQGLERRRCCCLCETLTVLSLFFSTKVTSQQGKSPYPSEYRRYQSPDPRCKTSSHISVIHFHVRSRLGYFAPQYLLPLIRDTKTEENKESNRYGKH